MAGGEANCVEARGSDSGDGEGALRMLGDVDVGPGGCARDGRTKVTAYLLDGKA